METINHECYVSLEVAKLLEEAGFDWECNKKFVFYNTACENEIEFSRSMCDPTYLQSPKEICIYQPTLDVAQRWLREVKGYYVFVTDDSQCVEPNLIWVITRPSYLAGMCGGSTYEDYLEAGIKKALEIILEKGK